MNTALKYTAFAVIATAVNIATQEASLLLYSGIYHIFSAMAFGTVAGLVVKYILDKKYIFNYQVKSKAHDGQLFFLYSLMGAVTTFIFWGSEFLFDHIFGTKEFRYLGAIIGLSIGYYVKFCLDRKFVFVS